MKPCLFCGSPKNSNEHIIASSVWTAMQAGNSTINVGIWDGIAEKEFRRPHPQKSYKTRSVCETCNNGWMSQLEAEFLKSVGPLIETTWPILAADFLEQALSKRDALARWAVKTAITVSASGIHKHSINPEIANDVRGNRLPLHLKVLIGTIQVRDFAITINPGFFFVNKDGDRKWGVGDKGYSFDAIFHLNHLAIRVFNGPGLKFCHLFDCKARPLPCYPATKYRIASNYVFQTLSEFEGELLVHWPHKLPPF